MGGALILAYSSTRNSRSPYINIRFINIFLAAGCLLLALFFIGCGYAHFKWADGVQFLIPEYIPFRLFWTYFCGVCLVAGGVGILIPKTRRLAALLSGIMVSGWFLLLHIPRFVANPSDPSDRLGLCESFSFVEIFFVLAGVFSNSPDS
jgi:uncharacterized membrane protein YphA (DoxX/SURF4 family)